MTTDVCDNSINSTDVVKKKKKKVKSRRKNLPPCTTVGKHGKGCINGCTVCCGKRDPLVLVYMKENIAAWDKKYEDYNVSPKSLHHGSLAQYQGSQALLGEWEPGNRRDGDFQDTSRKSGKYVRLGPP